MVSNWPPADRHRWKALNRKRLRGHGCGRIKVEMRLFWSWPWNACLPDCHGLECNEAQVNSATFYRREKVKKFAKCENKSAQFSALVLAISLSTFPLNAWARLRAKSGSCNHLWDSWLLRIVGTVNFGLGPEGIARWWKITRSGKLQYVVSWLYLCRKAYCHWSGTQTVPISIGQV